MSTSTAPSIAFARYNERGVYISGEDWVTEHQNLNYHLLIEIFGGPARGVVWIVE